MGISWGFSIVLLTVCVRAVLVPLTFRQIKSMVRMQALAPQMKEIQAKYKQDKERQSQEMMKFYRENNVNPLGSCLPLVLQLPVFISLYYMLRQSLRIDICPAIQRRTTRGRTRAHTVPCGAGHGAGFLFIPDLTDKASGVVLVVLILLYVGSQLGSTLVMSSAATMDPMQRRLMMFLPLVFVLFVFRFPAGVLVYWITTNFWTMGQQYVVRKRVGPRMAVAGRRGRRRHRECVRHANRRARVRGRVQAPPRRCRSPPPTPRRATARRRAAGGPRLAPPRPRAARARPISPTSRRTGTSNGAPAKSDSNRVPVRSRARVRRTGARARRSRASAKRRVKSSRCVGSSKASGVRRRRRVRRRVRAPATIQGRFVDVATDGAKPPPPPRKRKKRSGRRR